MSYIIKNKNELNGSMYIELYPDEFNGKHWNDASVFFEVHHWEYLLKALIRHYPSYNPYGFQTLNAKNWKPVITDWTVLAKKVGEANKVQDIRSEISFVSEYSEKDFMENELENLGNIKVTLEELCEWLTVSLEKSKHVAILGL